MRSCNGWMAAVLSLALLLLCSCSDVSSRLNDENANQMMREIRKAETTFKNTRGTGEYGTLAELIDAGLFAQSFADAAAGGHRYEIKTSAGSFEAIAVPLARDDNYQFVGWSFYLNETGVIRGTPYGKANNYKSANRDDPPIRYQ